MSFATSHYRDRKVYRKHRREEKARYRKRYGAGKYSPTPWSEEEIELITTSFLSDSQLAIKLGRSVSSVAQKRYRLRKAQKEELSK